MARWLPEDGAKGLKSSRVSPHTGNRALGKQRWDPQLSRDGAGEAAADEGSRGLSVAAISFAKTTAFRCNSQSNGSEAERPV